MALGLVCAFVLQSTLVTEELAGGGRLEYEVAAADASVRHGAFRRYDAEGHRVVLGEYEDGLRTGRWRFWHPNGRPWAIGEYDDGSRDGEWTFETADRERIARGEYEEGLPSGEWEFGEPWERASGDYAPFHETWGSLGIDVRGTSVDGSRHGRWTARWPDGTPMLEAWYDRDRRAGTWTFRHADGTFDPEFVSGEHGPAPLPEVLFADPCPTRATVTERPSTLDGPLDPSRVPALCGEDDASTRALVETWRGADEAGRALARDELLGLGPVALPAIVDELVRLDDSREEDREWARRMLTELVAPLFGGHSWIPTTADVEPDERALRLAALRVHSALVLTENDPTWWAFDLPTIPPPADGARSELLLEPPPFFERMALAPSTGGPGGDRGDRGRRASGGRGSGKALARGLEGSTRAPEADGRRASGAEGTPYRGYHDEGVTALALLALVEGGSSLIAGPYRENVVHGLSWLLSRQDPASGGFWLPFETVDDEGQGIRVIVTHRMYDHAIATLSLCRLHRASPTIALGNASRKAVDFALRARNPYGAWRYSSPPTGESDTSVTAWMVKALTEAERAGFDVDPRAYEGALHWIDEVTDPQNGRVGYDSMGSLSARMKGVNDRFPRDNGEPMTAAGLLCRFLLDQDPAAAPIMEKHAQRIRTKLPEWDPDGYGVDVYYWYYGTCAMLRMGGERYWKPWDEVLTDAVLDSQRDDGERAGSWDPIGVWGFLGGRVYSTALMCRCLQVRTSSADQR